MKRKGDLRNILRLICRDMKSKDMSKCHGEMNGCSDENNNSDSDNNSNNNNSSNNNNEDIVKSSHRTGDLTGDLTGHLTGSLTADLTGDLTGNLTGDLTGDLTGIVVPARALRMDRMSPCSERNEASALRSTGRLSSPVYTEVTMMSLV